MLSTYRAQQLASLLVDPDPNLRCGAAWSLYEAGFNSQVDRLWVETVGAQPRWWVEDWQLHDEIEQFLNTELNKSENTEGSDPFNGFMSFNLFLSLLCLFVLCLLALFVSMAAVIPVIVDLILIVRLARELLDN